MSGRGLPGLWYGSADAGFLAQQTFTHQVRYGSTIAAGDLNGDGGMLITDLDRDGRGDIVIAGSSPLWGGKRDNPGPRAKRRFQRQSRPTLWRQSWAGGEVYGRPPTSTARATTRISASPAVASCGPWL